MPFGRSSCASALGRSAPPAAARSVRAGSVQEVDRRSRVCFAARDQVTRARGRLGREHRPALFNRQVRGGAPHPSGPHPLPDGADASVAEDGERRQTPREPETARESPPTPSFSHNHVGSCAPRPVRIQTRIPMWKATNRTTASMRAGPVKNGRNARMRPYLSRPMTNGSSRSSSGYSRPLAPRARPRLASDEGREVGRPCRATAH